MGLSQLLLPVKISWAHRGGCRCRSISARVCVPSPPVLAPHLGLIFSRILASIRQFSRKTDYLALISGFPGHYTPFGIFCLQAPVNTARAPFCQALMYHAKASRNTGRVFEPKASKSSFHKCLNSSIQRPSVFNASIYIAFQPYRSLASLFASCHHLSPTFSSKMKKMHHLTRLAFFFIVNSIAIDASKNCACTSSLRAARLTGTSGWAHKVARGPMYPPPVNTGEYWRILANTGPVFARRALI